MTTVKIFVLEKVVPWARRRVALVRDFKRHPREAIVTVGTLAIVLLTASTLIGRGNATARIPTSRVQRGDLVIKVTESGELRALDQVTISAPTDKQILWMAPEGAYVEEGDTLIVFESEKYAISKSASQSGWLVERANLERAMSDLEAQRSKEEAAQKRYESLPGLAKKGFVQESEVEQARLDYLELKSRTRSMAASVNAARATVAQAQNSVAQEERKLRQGIIHAPRAGLVVYANQGTDGELRKISVGMTPFEGMDLMYLPDISSMLVDTEISEVDLARVSVGLPATVRLDAYPGVTFRGEVRVLGNLARRRINRSTGKATGARVFDVTIQVLDKDPRLKPGLTAGVDIIAVEAKNVLYVPLEAVFFDDREQPMVYIRKRGHIEARSVKLGESNDRATIVLENLKEGEELMLGRPGPA